MQVSLDPEFQRRQQHDVRQQPLPNFGMATGNQSGVSHMYASLLEESTALWDKFVVVTQVVASAATPASVLLAGKQRGHQHLLGRKSQFEPLLDEEGSKQPSHTAWGPARAGVFAQLQPQMLAAQTRRSHQTSQMQSLTALNYAIILLGCGAGVALATLYLFAKMRESDDHPRQQFSFANIPNPFATQKLDAETPVEPRQKKGGCC